MLTEQNLTQGQQDLIDALYASNILAIAPVGFGKCVCAQTAAQELIKDRAVERVLIVAPLKVCELTWAKEHKKWAHLNEPAMAIGTPEQREAAIESDNPLVVINIENIPWIMKKYDLWEMGFDGLVIDESSKFKSSGSKRLRALRPKLKDFKWRVGLSASPVSERGIDIYSQILLVDAGKALGRVQDVFRHKYFMTTDFAGYKWEFQPGGLERLAKALRYVVYTAEGDDYEANLPELREEYHYITLPDAAKEAYAAMAKDMIAEIEDVEIEAPSSAVMTLKLQQIAAGAVYDEDKNVHRLHNEKIEWLKGWLKPHRRVLVSYWFRYELEALREAFPGIAVLSDDPVNLEDAWNRKELPILALHPLSGSHGLNMQFGGFILVCLGPVWSLDQWSQMLGRIRRRGQESEYVERHVVIAADTVEDCVMMNRLAGKEAAESSIMEHLKQAARSNEL